MAKSKRSGYAHRAQAAMPNPAYRALDMPIEGLSKLFSLLPARCIPTFHFGAAKAGPRYLL